MILESIRILADAIADDEYGVNAQIAAAMIDAEDTPPPDVKLVGDITRDRWAADLLDPPQVPAILVAPAGPASLKGEVLAQAIRTGETVPVDVIYIGKDINSEDAFAHMMMTFRAVLRTLKTLMSNDQEAARLRNNVCVISANDVTWGLADMPLEAAGATGALTVSFEARDTA